MEEILESYDDFINEGSVVKKQFGVNFLVSFKVDSVRKKACFNFIPKTSANLDLMGNKDSMSRKLEIYLFKSTGLKYVYDKFSESAGLTFEVFLGDLEDKILKTLK